MLRTLLFSTLAAAIFGVAIQAVTPAPAQAQTSCMHCNFALSKCKLFPSAGPVTCEQKQTNCIQECKTPGASASGGDKAKPAATSEKKPKKKSTKKRRKKNKKKKSKK